MIICRPIMVLYCIALWLKIFEIVLKHTHPIGVEKGFKVGIKKKKHCLNPLICTSNIVLFPISMFYFCSLTILTQFNQIKNLSHDLNFVHTLQFRLVFLSFFGEIGLCCFHSKLTVWQTTTTTMTGSLPEKRTKVAFVIIPLHHTTI